MQRRRTPLLSGVFMWAIYMGMAMAVLVWLGVIVLLGGTWLVIGFSQAQNESTHYAVERLLYSSAEHPVSEEERTYRKAAAKDLLYLHEAIQREKRIAVIDDVTLEQIRHAAQTGDRIAIPDSRWHIDFSALIHWALWATWLFLGAGGVQSYKRSCCQGHRLADLPWKRPAIWLTVLVAGPALWLAFLVSAILMLGDRRLNVLTAWPGDISTEVLQGYMDFCNADSQRARQRLLEEAQEALGQAKSTASELAGQVREQQQQIAALTLRCRELQRPHEEVSHDVDIAEELRQMIELPGVLKVARIDEAIRFTIRTQYATEGKTFDLGDWVIDFEPGITRMVAICIRSGVRPSWIYSDPPYRHPNGDFCFGNQQQVIDEHLKHQRYLQAFSLAITCMNSINLEDEDKVKEVFEGAYHSIIQIDL